MLHRTFLILFCLISNLILAQTRTSQTQALVPTQLTLTQQAQATKRTTILVNNEQKIKKQVDSVFKKLSLREKVMQLFVIDFSAEQNNKKQILQNKLVHKGLGGLIIMEGDLNKTVERINKFNSIAKVPLIISIDGEWGAGMRFTETPSFPRQMQLGALSSDTLIYKMGYLIGKECKSIGINVNYAPDVDINNNPDNPVINTRSFGEDKNKVANFGAAYMQGMKDAGIATSAKHFPGHGDTNVDSHNGLPILPFDLNRLNSTELFPFKHLINQGVDMVMVGHLSVPALDSTNTPASISKPIITNFLKDSIGYNGIVCTDALNMNGLVQTAKDNGIKEECVALESFKAGADILLMPNKVEDAINQVEKAIRNKSVSMDLLNQKVRKILTLKAKLGLFNKNSVQKIDTTMLKTRVVKKENIDLIKEICEQSMTLVINKYFNSIRTPSKLYEYTFPLLQRKNSKIAYIGYGADENAKVFANTLLEHMNIDTFTINKSEITLEALESLKKRVKSYDSIILGIHDTDSRPHKNFGINKDNFKFLTEWASQQHIAAVYFGSPYALNKISGYKNFNALLIAYSNTLYNNEAAAKVILGLSPAMGVLPVGAGGMKSGYGIHY